MKNNSIKAILRNIRPLRSIHFILMVSMGCYFSRNFQVVTWILCIIAIFLAWQYDIHINDVFDIEIDQISHPDRPLVKRGASRKLNIIVIIIILTIVFGISISIGWLSTLIAVIYIGLGTLYSVPPFRFHQYIIATVMIGAGSIVAFFYGYFSLTTIISWDIVIIGLLIFLGLSMGTVVKDYKDYDGDKAGNITTIFTKFGKERGLVVSYVLLIITFLLPLVLIHQVTDIVVIIGFAVLTTIVFKLKKNVIHVFLFYFVILLYSFLRYEGFLLLP